MIVLRQGKAKNILENSINSALTAVETYNRPRVQFRIENSLQIFCENWQNPVKQRITPHFLTTRHSNYYEFTTKE